MRSPQPDGTHEVNLKLGREEALALPFVGRAASRLRAAWGAGRIGATMADFTQRAPVETSKSGDYLHTRDRIPEGPARDFRALAANWGWLAFGLLFGIGLSLSGWEMRDSWQEHRDWVMPVIGVAGTLAGLAAAHLIARSKLSIAAPGIFFLLLHVVFVIFDVLRGIGTDGESDAGRVALGVMAAIALTAGTIYLVIATVVVELTDPTRAPEPEV